MGFAALKPSYELSKVGSADPSAAFEAIGTGYLEWATANPTHFQIISS
jgi:hypothetical protein